MKRLFITCVIISIIYILTYYFYFRRWEEWYHPNFKKTAEENKLNQDEIGNQLCVSLNKRVNMLDHMGYSEWITYNLNEDNIYDDNSGSKNYYFIYEKTNDDPLDFVLKVTPDPSLVNLLYTDQLKLVNHDYLAFESFPTNPDLIKNMFNAPELENGCNNMSYFWIAHNPPRIPTKKRSYFKRFTKKLDNDNEVTGIIGIGYPIGNLETDTGELYFNHLGAKAVIIMVLITFLIVGVFETAAFPRKNSFDVYKPILLVILMNIYLLWQICAFGPITDIASEWSKVSDMNNGILAISFLVAVNIFILQSIVTNKDTKYLYGESAFLFCISLVLILIALFKVGNFDTVNDLVTYRIWGEIAFNSSIVINVFILINYLYSIALIKSIKGELNWYW